jgi:hypothetical protein
LLGAPDQAGVVDATGDFLATSAGTKNSDLDLVNVQAIHNNGGHTFTLSASTAVPEPASLALMLMGLGVMVGVGRRRRVE